MPGKTKRIELSQLETRDFTITQNGPDKGKVFKLARLSREQIAAWQRDALDLVNEYEGVPDSAGKLFSLAQSMNMLNAVFGFLAFVHDEKTPGVLRQITSNDAADASTIATLHLASIELHKDIIPFDLEELCRNTLTAAVKSGGAKVIFEDWKH